MITQEGWRELKAWARHGDHVSPSGARVGLDRRTVQQPLHSPPPPGYRRPPRPSTLRPFQPWIEPWLARAPGVRAMRRYQALRPHDGVPGSSPSVPRVVRRLRPPRPVEVYGRFETAPGQQAQGDWSDAEPVWGHQAGPG